MTTHVNIAGTGRRRVLGALVVATGCAIGLAPAAIASAHTETSAVAVPAGSDATVTFEPEHGCGESPTIAVRIQAPIADARADDVDGWTATSTPDDAGNSVLEWTGGSVPADQPGAFPVEFTVPDTVGSLLAFPAVQRCENGEELAWIGTQPGDEFPAPQVLVLAAGSEPAATLNDVAADAPGRDLLVALAESESDDDAEAAPATTGASPATTPDGSTTAGLATTTATASTIAPATTEPGPAVSASPATTEPAITTTTEGGDGGSSSAGWIIGIVAAVVVLGIVGITLYVRRRTAQGGQP